MSYARLLRRTATLSFALSIVACAGAGTNEPVHAGLHASRPYGLFVPPAATGTRVPLVVVLHGYSIDGQKEVNMLKLEGFAKEKGFALAWPDGTKDQKGYRFWNATDACCNWYGAAVDDVSYLTALIDEVSASAAIDPKRVYVLGHSNGAFMAHRFACERSEKIAAIATIAGLPWKDAPRCAPREPVSIVHLHGTKDTAIAIEGGQIEQNPAYPAARDAIAGWAANDRCAGSSTESTERFDYDRAVPGAETKKTRFAACARGSAVELWTLDGSSHEPDLTGAGVEAIYAFFLAHPKQ